MWGGLKVVTLFATCIALVACQRPGRQTSSFDKEKSYYLATGSPSGTYVQLGNAIAEAAETKVHVIPCTTQGSIDNLRLLRTGNVSFALVQMDSLHDELFHAEDSAQPETQQSAEEKQGILLVTFLYSEKMHLFVRPHFYLNSPADLHRIKDRRRVWLGPERSGTYRTAQRVLEASGLVDDEIKDFGHIRPQPESKATQHAEVSEKQEEDLNWNTAAQRLLEPLEQSTALYAYFRTTAVPRRTVPNERRNPLNRHTSAQIVPCPGIEPMVSANTESRTSSEPQPGPKLDTDDLLKADANIVPLSPTVIGHLAEDKLYVETTIELNTYEHLKRGAPTVGVPTVLVTNVDRNGGVVLINTVIRQIENHKSQIEDAIGGIELDQLSTPLRDDTLLYAVHPGAQDHLSPKKYASVWLAVIGLTAGVLLAVVVRNPRWIRRKLAAGSYVFLLVSILGIMWFLLGLAMSETEGRLNPDFANISNALLNSLRFVTGQLREYRLMTHQGRDSYLVSIVPLSSAVWLADL
jgi:TRAP-type uncharacterized transport system substrate-binding protein